MDAASLPLGADYYRRHAVRVRALVAETTTLAIREHRYDVARQDDVSAKHVEEAKREGSCPVML